MVKINPSHTPITVFILACVVCGQPKYFKVATHALHQWQHGTLIQNAFPEMSIDDREFMVSHICGSCFDKMFKE